MKKFIYATLLTIILTVCTVMPVCAEEPASSEVNTVTQSGTSQTELSASVSDSFVINLPKKIDLSGCEANTEYHIPFQVYGDLSGTKTLKLDLTDYERFASNGYTPVYSLVDKSGVKSEVDVYVSPSQNQWNYYDLKYTTESSPKEEYLNVALGSKPTAGEWLVNVKYNISLTD